MGALTEDDVRDLISAFDGVRILIRSQSAGTPRAAWGDTFSFYDPDSTGDEKMPFATNVTHDTPGWDEVSNLDRLGRDRQPSSARSDELLELIRIAHGRAVARHR